MPADAAAPLLQVDGLCCSFASARRGWRAGPALRAVERVSFTIARGETFGLVGESGCGKSTLGRLVSGLQPASSGTVRFDGLAVRRPEDMPARIRHRMQMIFQDPYASLNPRWRIGSLVGESLVLQGLPSAARQARVEELLQLVGLGADDRRRTAHEFSGGQRQRIAIARALAANPDFLICDEPTSALDVSVQAQVLNLLRELQRKLQLTLLFISHNLAAVSIMADRVGVMYLGRLVELAPAGPLFEAPQHPYTRMLLAALPDLDMTGRAPPAIIGEPPSPLSMPGGCRFHPRCPLAMPVCQSVEPAFRAITDTRFVACHAVPEHPGD